MACESAVYPAREMRGMPDGRLVLGNDNREVWSYRGHEGQWTSFLVLPRPAPGLCIPLRRLCHPAGARARVWGASADWLTHESGAPGSQRQCWILDLHRANLSYWIVSLDPEMDVTNVRRVCGPTSAPEVTVSQYDAEYTLPAQRVPDAPADGATAIPGTCLRAA